MKKRAKRSNKINPLSYKDREYRRIMGSEKMVACQVSVNETDLYILADNDVRSSACRLVLQFRSQIELYIHKHPHFLSSLSPLGQDPLAAPIVKSMLEAARSCNVGPMAAVAGAIAEYVGKELLLAETDEVIIENGGDIFMHRNQECIAAIFAGASPLSNKVGIKIARNFMPLGICTSSGTIGHSLSLGQADSVTVLASSTALADAAATRLGNELKEKSDMGHALAVAVDLPALTGVVIVMGDQLGAQGDVELVPLT